MKKTQKQTNLTHSDQSKTSGEEIFCYCIRLRRAANTVTDFYDRMLEPFGVSVNQFFLLISLARYAGMGTGRLAGIVGLEKSTLVRSLQPLIKEGWVEDCAPAGSRAHSWRLTAAGKSLLASAMPVWEKAQAKVLTALGGRQHLLWDCLADIVKLDDCQDG